MKLRVATWLCLSGILFGNQPSGSRRGPPLMRRRSNRRRRRNQLLRPLNLRLTSKLSPRSEAHALRLAHAADLCTPAEVLFSLRRPLIQAAPAMASPDLETYGI